MELRREILEVGIRQPGGGDVPLRQSVELRWDPLTGHGSRIIEDAALLPSSDFDLQALAEETRPDCPFCSDRLEHQTPRLSPAVSATGRIRRGEAVLFPNLIPYSKHSSVSVYSPDRHFLPLEDITPRLMTDNLYAQVEFQTEVMAHDESCRWGSINANHMLPSGSSVFHPHLQGGVHPHPSTVQRLLNGVPAQRFSDYLDTERRIGERYLGSTGRVEWLTSFAPMGPGELRAFLPGFVSATQMSSDLIEELGRGIAAAVKLYAELGCQSFNMALYGAPPGADGYMLNLRMICRSNLQALYRSDATWLERLHWEAAVDIKPEELAARAVGRFGP